MISLNLIKLILPILYLTIISTNFLWNVNKPSDARKVSPNVDERVQQAIQEGRGFRI